MKTLCAATLFATFVALCASPASAEDAIIAPAQKKIGVPKARIASALLVINARGATLESGKLTLSGVQANAIAFADRPVRAAGHVLTAHLLEAWSGGDTFAKDPPNATVSVLSRDASASADAVVVLRTPKLQGDTLTFDVQVLEGGLTGADGPASVFIDTYNFPFLSALANGAAQTSANQGAWYRAHGDYAQPTPSSDLGPAFMNNGMDESPWQ